MSFAPYPLYSGSGISTIGEIPAHWKVRRLKTAAAVMPSNVDKKSYDGEQVVRLCNYTDVYYNDVITRDLKFMEATASDEQIARFELRAGDVIITKDSETADDIAIAAYVPQDLPGVVCGYHLAVVRARDGFSGAFIKRLFDSAYVKAAVEVRANGLTRVGLSQYALDNLELAFPPLEEQEAISEFLERETAQIDELIAGQRRLIELAKDKRRALISHAVTRGLNCDAPMKPSGVAWVGNVPAHWAMPPMFLRYDVALGKMLDEKRNVGSNPVPYLRNADVNWDRISAVDLPEMDVSAEELERYTVRPGDLLICEGGAGVGQTAIWEGQRPLCAFQKALHRLRALSERENPRFMYYLMRFTVEAGAVLATGNTSTIPHLTNEKLRSLRLPCPPLEEQDAIVSFLDSEMSVLDELVTQIDRSSRLLQERRAALISAAVTGRIDVRDLADVDAEAA